MSSPVNAGKIEGPETKILWNISNYFSQPQKADSCIESPIFHSIGSTWCLIIYPNGKRDSQSVGSVGLYIRRINPNKDIEMFFGLKMIDDAGEEFAGHFSQYNFYKSVKQNIGWPCCIERDHLLRYKDQYVPQGTLTIKFVVKSFKTVSATETEISDGVRTLVRDFQLLLTSKQKSDVTIYMKNRVYQAHKLILGARSTVFAAMFEHDMKEKFNGVVNITDCDPDAFQDFLSFIYTGKIENLSSDKAINLHYLAEKYAICDLKQICLDFMGKNLSLNNVCDILAIANKFSATKLKKSAEELLGNNLKSIMKTKYWIDFIRKNPELATEILIKYT